VTAAVARPIAAGRVAARSRARRGVGIGYVLLGVVLVATLFPFAWTILDSLNTNKGIFDGQLVPDALHWENYPRAWQTGRLQSYFGNSVVVAVASVALTLAVCCPAGYAFGRLRFPGSRLLFYAYLLGLTVPFQAVLIPIFYMLKSMGLIDSLLGIVLTQVGTGVPFGAFLMRNFFRGLPNELADAARIDGCNELSLFWRVMLPLVRPAALALLIFSFMGSWNDYLLPLIALQTDARRTLPVGLVNFSTQYVTDYSLVFAATVITFLPVIAVYLLFQRQFVEGISVGATKG
jgi:ABC-type glycerol-3-phosphate transport system permease component